MEERINAMTLLQKAVCSGIAFVLTVGLGIWLSSVGKPYQGLLFNVHKLAALSCVVFGFFTFLSMFKTTAPTASFLFLTVVAAVAILAVFVTGAFLSIGNTPYALTKSIHILALIVAVCAVALSVFLYLKK